MVGIGSNAALPAILERVAGGETVESYGPKTALALGGARVISTPRHFAYLKIAEGCNNRCHYCRHPHDPGPAAQPSAGGLPGRGPLAGRGRGQGTDRGGQDPTAYGDDQGKNQICELLRGLNAIEGLVWIRLLYAYPERITDEFIETLASCDKVVKYLDLPIQHCNDEILKGMNRKGGRAAVDSAITRLRAAIPDIVLRTTLIAGFPGESEEQFEELCQFVHDVRFDRLGCFAYSAEENTVAATMPGQIEEEEKQRRADRIMDLQSRIMGEKQAAGWARRCG